MLVDCAIFAASAVVVLVVANLVADVVPTATERGL